MNNLMEHILAARKNGGWTQMLIPLIFFAAYALNALAKVKEKNRRDKELDKELAEKPKRYKPITGQQQPQAVKNYKPLHAAESAKTPRQARHIPYARPAQQSNRPQPAQQRRPQPAQPTLRQQQVTNVYRQAVAKAQRQQVPEPQKQQARPQPVPKATTEKVAAVSKETPRGTLTEYLQEMDNLRRAIVLSEILGKPLALRNF